jgi:geranylgeranyl diphosphate synthase type I
VAGGKALRPAVVLLAAAAMDGSTVDALPAAVAVELVHNFSLLHDDVMDADDIRHHRPTVWSVFGVSAAILAGDALLTLALDVLAGSGHPAAQPGMRMLGAAVQDLVEGQSADVDFERRSDVDLAECERMSERKTGALLECAGGIGALFGGGTPARVDRLRAFGSRLGLAFQHADDLIGIWGDPAVTGKPIHSDLRNRKKTLPVVAALTSGTPPGDVLAGIYHSAEPLSDNEVAHAAELVERAGGRAWSQAQADLLLAGALRELAAAGPAARPAAELADLARLATHRDS